jgi:hypothetical protein
MFVQTNAFLQQAKKRIAGGLWRILQAEQKKIYC